MSKQTALDVKEILSAVDGLSDQQMHDADFLRHHLTAQVGINQVFVTKDFPDRNVGSIATANGMMQCPMQFARFLTYVAATRPASYVELGAASGLSFILVVAFLQRLHRKPIKALSIDIAQASRALLEFCSIYPSSVTVRVDTLSPHAASSLSQFGNFDLAFIDADHSYNAVSSDHTLMKKMANVVAFHDVLTKWWPGSVRFWQELLPQERLCPIEISEGLNDLGIGVVLADPFAPLAPNTAAGRHAVLSKTMPRAVYGSVASWDCFDTLIARRYISPISIFRAVEHRLSISGFAQQRNAVSAPTLDRIYDTLAEKLGWSPDASAKVKSAEIEMEMEHCIPIAENILRVRPNDLILSDMYLPTDVIARMLIKCGLRQPVRILVSPGGKASGAVWDHLVKTGLAQSLSRHTGDNAHSDGAMPYKYGVVPSIFEGSALTKEELELGNAAGSWMRYVRLQCPYGLDQPALRNIWVEQTTLNLPILYQSVLEIEKLGRPPVFVYRDGVHLAPLYATMTGKEAKLFHSSRRMSYHGIHNEEYCGYVESTTLGRLVVDIQGVGTSLSFFYDKTLPGAQLDYAAVFLRTRSGGKYTPLTESWCVGNGFYPGIESLNASKDGTLIDFKNGMPIRAACEHPADALMAQYGAVKLAVESYKFFRPTYELPGEVIRKRIHLTGTSESIRTFSFLDHPGSLPPGGLSGG